MGVRSIHYIPIYPFNIQGGTHSNLSVYGYLFINDGRVLPRKWQGINARVKNVTIDSTTYFGFEEDPASRNRIGGELFILNIDENHAITTNRSGFATENNDYLLVAEYMRQRISSAQEIVRKHSAIDSTVKKLVNSLDRLRDVFKTNAAIQDERDDNELFKLLDDESIEIDEVAPFSLETALKAELDKEKSEFELVWSGVIEDLYQVEPHEDQFYTIFVHEDLRNFIFNIAGNAVEYHMAYCGELKPLLMKKPGAIYLNLDNTLIPNKDITRIKIGLVETFLTLYLNYLRCKGNADYLYTQTKVDLLKT